MRTLIIIALLSFVLVAGAHAQIWIMTPSGGGRVLGGSVTPPGTNCILIQTGSCLLYNAGSSNTILVQ